MRKKILYITFAGLGLGIFCVLVFHEVRNGFHMLHRDRTKLSITQIEDGKITSFSCADPYRSSSYTNGMHDSLSLSSCGDVSYIQLNLALLRNGHARNLRLSDREFKQSNNVSYYEKQFVSKISSGEIPFHYTSTLLAFRGDFLFISFSGCRHHQIGPSSNDLLFQGCTEVQFSPDGVKKSHSLSFNDPVEGSIHFDPTTRRLNIRFRKEMG